MVTGSTVEVAQARTHVMSCDASIVVTGPTGPDRGADACERGVERLHELERRWSRFLPDSEISRLNAAAGAPCRVGDDTVRLVEGLVRGWYATDGAFDPTLLGTLVELGYAASRDDATARTSLSGDALPQGRPDAILVDPDRCLVQLPRGTTLDPGGLGKGLAADIVVAELRAAGAAGVLVEIGGDVRVAGRPPDGDAWAVAVRGATAEAPARIVDLADGGVATSSSRLRTWSRAGRTHHHLIDPHTRTSTTTEVVSCTVIAGTAAVAETFTKLAFVDGASTALERFAARSLAASITTSDGISHTTDAWEDFAR